MPHGDGKGKGPRPERGLSKSLSTSDISVGSSARSNGGVRSSMARASSNAALPPLRVSPKDVSMGLPSTLRQLRNPLSQMGGTSSMWAQPTLAPADGRPEAFRRFDIREGGLGLDLGKSKSGRAEEDKDKKSVAPQARAQAEDGEEGAALNNTLDPHILKIQSMYIEGLGLTNSPTSALHDDGDEEGKLETHELDAFLMKNNGGIEVNEDEIMRRELAALHTGEDAIAFFAKNNAVTKTKLLYCNRAEAEDGAFAPYDLRVVPEGRVNPEYFTISNSGIVHVCPGQLSECISLVEWMKQSLMYRVLTSMSFFKYYIHRKVFSTWQVNARYEVYNHHRQRLARSCFLAKPLFVEPLTQIHSLIHEVEEIKVMIIDQSCDTLDAFAYKQNLARSNQANGAQKEFEQKHDHVMLYLDRLIATVNRSIETDPHPAGLPGQSKTKSMVQEKLEARERARHQRTAIKDRDMIGDCIRMVDHMFQAALVAVVIRAGADLSARLETSHKLFIINVGFGEKNVTLDPPREHFMEKLHELWEGTVQAVSSIRPFATERPYEPYCRILSQLPIRDVMHNNKKYNYYVKRIMDDIGEQIDTTLVYANETYEPFRRIYKYGQDWDDEAFFAIDHDYEDLYTEMMKMQEFQEDLERFRAHHVLGIISVRADGLKSQLSPIPETAIGAMKKCLTSLAREKCSEAFRKFDEVNKRLDERPRDLGKFADYVKYHQQIMTEQVVMEELMEEVETMYGFLKQNNVKISLDDQVQEDGLKAKEHDFIHSKMLLAKSFIDEQNQDMANETYQKSLEVEDRMRGVVEDLSKGSFIDSEKIPYASEVLEELDRIGEKQVQFYEEKARTYEEYETLLGGVPQNTESGKFEFNDLDNCKKVFDEKYKLWKLVAEWNDLSHNWNSSDFPKVDVEDMNKKVTAMFRTITVLNKSMPNDEVVMQAKSYIEEWRERLPAILDLGNPAMRPRHWEKLFKKINMIWKGASSAQNVSLQMLEANGIFEFKEFISEISGMATGEFTLETQLEHIKDAWSDLPLPIMNHRNQKDLWILADLTDIIAMCEDHSVTIATMMGSRFVHGIKESVEDWEKRINLASDVIDEWYQVQRAWMYLENIFSAEDIQHQLPQEAAKFKSVDKFWKDLFRKVRQSYKNAIDAFRIPDLLNKLKWANDSLDHVQKKLEAYLETKRAAFPRFYFLSNDELLSILSQTRNPHAVQEHLCKCFDAINRVEFSETEKGNIIAMKDMIKERVPFVEPVVTGPIVEKWLADVEVAMVNGIYANTKEMLHAYPEDGTHRTDWLLAGVCSQALLLVDQINWTHSAEVALDLISSGQNANGMSDCIDFHNKQLANSVSIVRMNLTKLQRTLMGAMIVLDVHGITVLENLRDSNCSSVHEFDWSKQLRYYWIAEDAQAHLSSGHDCSDDCVCRQTIGAFKYSHEYLGNTPRLVVTPLTDKCYMTLTGAMHLNYGGAPAGPAGTGKTETTKDLGKALAVPVVVFNCSDGLDYKIMGRFFSGLAQAGAWACFDEFNRIQVEVLSVIAQQMLTVTQAIRARKDIFEFLGNDIPLNRRFGVFITMNPGYAGRAELPDNLKALFRPVAMMVPDYGLIAQIILYSEGFNGATVLARKMVNLYRLSSEQLSKQDHYDFGMRAVKSVLVMAGHLKRQNPELEENVTLIRALRDSNAPKFLSFDLPLFSGIITDLYPSVTIPTVDYGNLKVEIERQLRLMHLQIVPAFVEKITQLLETQIVRHGVMLVGLTMTGKSTNSTILSKTLSQLKKDGSTDPAHQLTKVFHLNPKSITIEELYGSFNENTGEWKDGLVAILVREAVSDTSDNKKWVNFDGPVDALWIENMNTVLDDNKMLCMANGERIKLPPSMCVMFEVADLAVASPATVSRCGMVYIEPVHLKWMPLIASWTEKFEEKFPKYAKDIGKWTLDVCTDALQFIRDECQEAPGIPTMDSNLVQAYLRMLTTFICEAHQLVPESGDQVPRKPLKTDAEEAKLVRMYTAMAAVWSLGSNLHDNSRKKFVDFIRPKLKKFCEDIPSEDLYMTYVDDAEGKFAQLSSMVPTFTYDAGMPFFNILVPTAETTGQRLQLENLMRAGFSCLFSGETGVGKSVGIQQFLNTAGETFSTATANFSAQTSCSNVVDMLENRLERKRKNLLGAPPGTTMLFFVDDINMPMLEYYGAQPPIELLRQVVDCGGFYDKKKLFWKHVESVKFIAACGPPGGGRMVVTPRLFRHFNMIWMPVLSEDAMHRILSSILGGWLGVVKPELNAFANPIIRAMVEMFFKITADLLPTPVKCHYIFNLRDPAKSVQGMLMIDVKSSLKDKDSLISLFLHETCRQFRDRLIDDKDRDWFNSMLCERLNAQLPGSAKIEEFKDKLYGDFLDRGERPYQYVDSMSKCTAIFNEWLDDYNTTHPTKMDVVYFQEACFHLARCTRTIRQPRGNLLLVGVSGVGRKCTARMGAHMADYQCFAIEITRHYDSTAFKEDIKTMMQGVAKSGGKGMMFLFSDTQIVKESFLEDINNILNTGEVPNLFAPDELEGVISSMRKVAKDAGRPDTRDSIWQYFVQTVRDNLHIVLAFSPVGEGFRARCRQFPSIINCASIDWFSPWPTEALYAVAERNYGAAPSELGLESLIPSISKISGYMHSSAKDAAEDFFESLRRRTYMTPTSYLELIGLFIDLVGKKRGELKTKLDRYSVGVKTLNETKVVVDELKVKLTKMQPEITQAQKDTAALMVKVTEDQKIAKEKSEACAVDEAAASAAAREANAIKTDCQKDLDEALPEYNNAIKSLDSLDKKDIQEVKSFKTPPALVEVVLGAICLLMGSKETWQDGVKLMNDSKFLDNLKSYDKEALANNAKLTKQLQKYIKRDDFFPDQVKKVSNAATSLCMWVRAMDTYGRVARTIAPKKEKLAGAEEAERDAADKLAIAKAELKVVLDNVASLEAQLRGAKQKAAQLEADAEDCVKKLDRAEKLLSGLGNEAVRWDAASNILEKNLKFVIGNIILAGGFIAYSGPFTAEFRRDLTHKWLVEAQNLGLATDPTWKLQDVLVDPAEVRKWSINGLPADDLSVENGIMVTRGRRWPLMVDPQGQANRWVRNFGKEKNITITKLTDGMYLRKLEACIRNGNALLIENVEEVLDPALEPVLAKAIFKKGGQFILRLGDTDVPYNYDFAFYITTKMANPHYLPEVCIKVTIVNFMVTLLGLEDQLVAEVVNSERPDLGQMRAELVVQIAADKKTQDDLEQRILQLLADAKGDVLKDDSLINVLDASKKTGDEIAERMTVADKAMAEIDIIREKLRPVATRASILYFVVADLANIDPMYQYSLEFFVVLIQDRLRSSEKDDDMDKRIEILISDFTRFIYLNICRGLFEDHKLLFSFLTAAQVLRNEVHSKFLGKKPVTQTEWVFFLRGLEAAKGVLEEHPDSMPTPPWVKPAAWHKLDILEQLTEKAGSTTFKGLREAIAKGGEWEKYCLSDALHAMKMPGGWDTKLTAFEQMLVVRSMRENLTTLAARNVVAKELGEFFTVAPPFDLSKCYEDSQHFAPLIFVLSPGADPTEALLGLAVEKEYSDRLKFISLGQGQGPIAEAAIKLAWDTGDWVCLQNCHLAASWMGRLEQIQESQEPDKMNPDYRLWLTSMPSKEFPVAVLQNGLKINKEPPKGLRANVSSTFKDISEEVYEACSEKPREFKKLLFGLAFFHAVILERRKFGPIGWNIPYDWMESDFQVSRQQVGMYLLSQPDVPWTTLRYIIAEVNYGGRVTDDKDVILIAALLNDYFNDGMMKEGFCFAGLKAYTIPPEGPLEDTKEALTKLPMDEDPRIFGLHPNALITAQFGQARKFIDTVVSVQPRISGGGGGKKPEEVVESMAESFLAALPDAAKSKDAHPETYRQIEGGGIISIGVFHSQEYTRFASMMKKVKASLKNLGKAIKGIVLMSADMEGMYNSFLVQKVPANWQKVAYPCLKPLNSWIEDYSARMDFMTDWLLKGPPMSFWVSCFFFPQGFMTASLQLHARKTKIPIDTLEFFSNVTPHTDPASVTTPASGVNVHGLFLQGACWDVQAGQIKESDPDVLFVAMPVIWLDPVDSAKAPQIIKERNMYECPIYKTSERRGTLSTTGHSTNFVKFFPLTQVEKNPSHWVSRGVAMLCMLDD